MSFYNQQSPVWHPYTQMQGTEIIPIASGKGAYVYDDKGNRYIDAVASWWTNLHGHAHPHIAQAIATQASKLEQVIFAGFTHKPAEVLATELLKRIPFQHKIFYTDNGSTAVEVALKMALQYWSNQGEERNKIICFKDAYHGDTFGSMSISARGVFTGPYQKLLFDVAFIDTPDYTNGDTVKQQLSTLLKQGDIAAFIFEPLILGSAGMLMYTPELLNDLIGICKAHNVPAISDEVMTGFGRTGKFLAVEYCENKPDIVCLSKGITGGFLPFAATTCTEAIYNVFLSEERIKMLFHGHSYTANPLGCAAAIASMQVFEQDNTFAHIARIEEQHRLFANSIKNHHAVKQVRQQGTIVALEIETGTTTGYLNNIRDKAYRYFIDRKIILRPLGNIIYILPPYCISNNDLEEVYTAIRSFLDTL
jgi:adenosylmethionine-8-amino-7-oxononanoate aminotransferase